MLSLQLAYYFSLLFCFYSRPKLKGCMHVYSVEVVGMLYMWMHASCISDKF